MAGEMQKPPLDLRALDWSAAENAKVWQKARLERKYAYELERKITAYKDKDTWKGWMNMVHFPDIFTPLSSCCQCR